MLILFFVVIFYIVKMNDIYFKFILLKLIIFLIKYYGRVVVFIFFLMKGYNDFLL